MGSSGATLILVFTKVPVAGFAKTRLIPALGPEGAAQVSKELSEHCMHQVRAHVLRRRSGSQEDFHVQVHFAGHKATVQDVRRWLGPEREGEEYMPQVSGDLGDRLRVAFEAAFRAEAGRVIVVGTDIPEVSGPILEEAERALDTADFVVGPAADGGYYLLGMRQLCVSVFDDIAWSTKVVLQQTLERIKAEEDSSVHLLPTLTDIDTEESLPLWERIKARTSKS